MAQTYNITIEQDSDFYQQFTITESGSAVDLSSYTFEAKVADSAGGTVWTDMDSGGFVNSELRTSGAIRVWGGVDGILHVYIEETTVNGVTDKTSGWWTLNANDGTDVTRWLDGTVTYSKSAI